MCKSNQSKRWQLLQSSCYPSPFGISWEGTSVLSSPSALPAQHVWCSVNDLTIPEVVKISWAEAKRVKTTAELFLASRTLHSGWILLWWWLNPLLSSLQGQSEEADSYDKSLLFNKSLPYEPNKLPSISIQIYRRHICCSIQIYIHICCSLCRTWMLKKEDCVWQKYCRSLYVCICTD